MLKPCAPKPCITNNKVLRLTAAVVRILCRDKLRDELRDELRDIFSRSNLLAAKLIYVWDRFDIRLTYALHTRTILFLIKLPLVKVSTSRVSHLYITCMSRGIVG